MSATPSNVIPFPQRAGFEQWLTKRQVAEILGVSERWIEHRMSDSRFPCSRDPHGRSRAVRFRMSEVNDWMTRRAG